MKKLFLILTLFISIASTAQITGTKISAMPNYTGNVDSAYVPIIINGQNKKTQAYNVNKNRIDSLVVAVGAGISQWGQIGGTLSNQLDLQAALNARQATLVSGTNIKTINGASILSSGNISTLTDPTTTTGDIIYRNSSGALTRLAIGASTTVLTVASGIPAWTTQLRWSGDFPVVATSTTNATMADNTPVYTYLGVGGHVFTLPTLVDGSFFVKNAGSGSVTVQRGGTATIYTSSSVTSFVLAAGQSVFLTGYSSTSTWQALFLNTASSGSASDLTSGTLDDARLSGNVPLLNVPNTFTATNSFNSATITGSLGYTPVTNARTITVGSETFDLTANRSFYPKTPFQRAIEALGSEVKGQSVGVNMDQMSTTSFDAADGTAYWTAVWLPSPQTLTGVKFWLGAQGNFTGDNFNGFALYTYSAGTLTQVATSANDETIWKGTANTFQTVPFTATYSASAGLYFVAFIFNSSATTTAPKFGISASVATGGMQAGDFTNSAKLNSTQTSQTTLSSTKAFTSLTVTTLRPWIGLY
jgi:hypothetical protein